MEWWRRVMGAEDIVRGIKGFVEMETGGYNTFE